MTTTPGLQLTRPLTKPRDLLLGSLVAFVLASVILMDVWHHAGRFTFIEPAQLASNQKGDISRQRGRPVS